MPKKPDIFDPENAAPLMDEPEPLVSAPDALKPAPEPLEPGQVHVRVLKKGHGKVFTGEHDISRPPKDSFLTYSFGAIFVTSESVGRALEDAGLGEIQEEPQA